MSGAGTRMELLTFRLEAALYAIDIMAVREVRGYAPPTPLPQAPPSLKGVINLRGRVLPVIDLGVTLGPPRPEAGDRRVIIVVQLGESLAGLLVDRVLDILHLPAEALQEPPELAPEGAAPLIRGLILEEEQVIRLLDLERCLEPARRGAA